MMTLSARCADVFRIGPTSGEMFGGVAVLSLSAGGPIERGE